MGFNTNMANREVCDLIFLDYLTKSPFLNLDYANVTTTELTGETVYAYGGKGHPKRVAFDGEKGGTLTIETQMQSVKLWQLITGGEVAKTAKYYVRKVVAVSGGTSITLDEEPIDGTVVVFKVDDDCGTPLETSGTGSSITITETIAPETQAIVYYMKNVTEKVTSIKITTKTFPKDFIVYGDTIMKGEDGSILPYRLIAYKLHPQSTMTLTFSNSGDPGTLTITCDLMADQDDNMLELILEEDE